MSEFYFELIQQFGELSKNEKGWTRDLTFIRWNGKSPKYDLRDWAPDRLKMGRGISMTTEEVIQLRGLLNGMDLDKSTEKK